MMGWEWRNDGLGAGMTDGLGAGMARWALLDRLTGLGAQLGVGFGDADGDDVGVVELLVLHRGSVAAQQLEG